MLAEWRECISQVDQRDAMVRPDLSFITPPAAE
jgi:hypothetical protein